MAAKKELLLITGATGNVGTATVTELCRLVGDKAQVRAGVHHMERAELLKKTTANLMPLDADKKDTLDKAFVGVDRCFIIPSSNEKRAEQTRHYVDACKRHGVKQILLLSVIGAENKTTLFARQFREMEEYIEKSGISYCYLQCGYFQQNFMVLTPFIKNGELPMPIGAGSFAPVDVSDIARCACTILTTPVETHLKKKYIITGPECMSGIQMAKAVSEGLGGKPVKFVNQDPSDCKKALMSRGMPEWQANGMLELYQLYAKNLANFTSPDCEKLTVKKGTRLCDFMKAHAACFA